jgi:hypothetical protein
VRTFRTSAAIAFALLAPAAHGADTLVTGWPGCCSAATPDHVVATTADTFTIDGDFSHPLAWRDDDFTVTNSGPRTFTFPRAGTYAFYCTIHTGTMVGRVKVGNDLHATPDFAFAPAAPKAGELVTFTYTGTADPDGAIVSYRWDLDGNGTFEKTTATGTTGHTYAAAGTFAAKVVVVDDGHESSAPVTKNVVVADTGSPSDGEPAGSGPGQDPGTGGPQPGGDQAHPPGADTAAPAVRNPRVAGGRLRFALAEPATLTGTLLRGTRTVRRLRASLPAGSAAVKLPRKLKPGRYRVRFTLTDAAGNRSRSYSVRFRVTSAASAVRRRGAPPRR